MADDLLKEMQKNQTSFILAILTWKFIEKQAINFGRNIISKSKKA
jgi:peptidoglycan/LPS O-acetylase OafA/YrhL